MTTRQTFLALFEQILEVAPGTLKGDDVLAGMDGWDSLAVVSLIAMVDEQCGITLSPRAIAKAESVEDLIGLLGDRIAS